MKAFDREKIKDRIVGTISMEEALKDVEPMEWSEEVLNGEKNVVVEKCDIPEKEDACVKLEISYL